MFLRVKFNIGNTRDRDSRSAWHTQVVRVAEQAARLKDRLHTNGFQDTGMRGLTVARQAVDGRAQGRTRCKLPTRPCGQGYPDMRPLALLVDDTEVHFGPERNMVTKIGEK